MAAGNKQADTLVEEGLQLYKTGNLEAALARWTTALGLVKDHPQALEYYKYVLDNRAALEESFQLAADVSVQEDQQIALSEEDPDAEFDKRPSSFAGGSVAPGVDGRSPLEPKAVPGDPSVLEPLGEDDATPVVAIPVEEKTSRIGRELLEAQLEESRGDEEQEEDIFSAGDADHGGGESNPMVGGLPHILLQEAAEDDEGSAPNPFDALDVSIQSAEETPMASDKRDADDTSGSDPDEFILISDDDYSNDVDLANDDSDFAWEEGPSVKSGGKALSVELSDDDAGDAEGGADDLLLLDDPGDPDPEEGIEVVGDAEVLGASPVEDLLELSAPHEPDEDDLVDDDGSVGHDHVMELGGSGPDIPDLPQIPLTAPFDGLQDSSEDKSWVKEELERVSSAQELNMDLPPPNSDDSRGDMDLGGLEVTSDTSSGSPIKEIRSLMHDGKLEEALKSCERILQDVPDDRIALETRAEISEQLQEIYSQRIGDLEGIPTVQVPRHEIVWQNLDHRTGFLLSRIDGFLSYQDIIDVSGMAEFEAFRIIVGLMDEEIIGVN